MATYPTTPTTLTLDSAFAGAILRDYRDSGFVQGTAVIRDVNKTKQSVDVRKVTRQVDFLTAKTLSVAGVQTALATTDVCQVIPIGPGEVITSGSLRVIRAASGGATNTITVRLGATEISAAINCLAAATTVVATALPITVTSADTVDFLFTGTTVPVFDAKVELSLEISSNRG
jgi:hypothetical protein